MGKKLGNTGITKLITLIKTELKNYNISKRYSRESLIIQKNIINYDYQSESYYYVDFPDGTRILFMEILASPYYSKYLSKIADNVIISKTKGPIYANDYKINYPVSFASTDIIVNIALEDKAACKRILVWSHPEYMKLDHINVKMGYLNMDNNSKLTALEQMINEYELNKLILIAIGRWK